MLGQNGDTWQPNETLCLAFCPSVIHSIVHHFFSVSRSTCIPLLREFCKFVHRINCFFLLNVYLSFISPFILHACSSTFTLLVQTRSPPFHARESNDFLDIISFSATILSCSRPWSPFYSSRMHIRTQTRSIFFLSHVLIHSTTPFFSSSSARASKVETFGGLLLSSYNFLYFLPQGDHRGVFAPHCVLFTFLRHLLFFLFV